MLSLKSQSVSKPARTEAEETRRAKFAQRWFVISAVGIAVAGLESVVGEGTLTETLARIVATLFVLSATVFSLLKSNGEARARAVLAQIQGETASHLLEEQKLLKAEKERSAILLGHNLEEVFDSIDALARLPTSDRPAEIAAVQQSAAVQTKEGVGAVDARAAYFRVVDVTAEVRKMRPSKVASSVDRTDKFSAEFDEDSGRDSNVWEVLDGSEPTFFVEDISKLKDPRIDTSVQREYATFITATVSAGGLAFGILTVNARSPGSLVREDTFLVQALARALAIAELLTLSPQKYKAMYEATRLRSLRKSLARDRINNTETSPEEATDE